MKYYVIDNYKKRKGIQVFWIAFTTILLVAIVGEIVAMVYSSDNKALMICFIVATIVCVIAFCCVLLLSLRFLYISKNEIKLFNGIVAKTIKPENVKAIQLAHKKYSGGMNFWEIIIILHSNKRYLYIIDDLSRDQWRLKETKEILQQVLSQNIIIEDNWSLY